ncbi:MAG: PKD domain-containing protein, partial [Bacteroidota bacterium]
GGIPPYTHHWNNGTTTSMACLLVPGTWCDTITDSQGCRDTACILIEPLAIQPIPPDTVCFGMTNGSTCVTAYGGSTPYGYNWSNNSTQSCLINVNPGTYSVTVTDASGGVVLGSAIIYENPQITATFTRDTVSCGGGSDGSITITPSGGTPYLNPPEYSFLWSNGSTTNVASGLTAGSYSVTVTDSIGCPQPFAVVMPQPSPIIVGFRTSSNCVTYSAEALVSGGNSPYTYLWTGGQTTNPASGLSPGNYSVTVTDAKSCTKTASVTVSALAVAVISTNVTCFGACDGTATATASGGNLPYTITWKNSSNIIVIPSETTPVSAKIINLCPGDYTVTVVDSNNCPVSQTVTISQPANPLAITTLTYTAMLDCFGDCDGVAAVFASGGTAPYTYKWENSATPGYIIGTAQNIAGLCAGTYCVTVTDFRGCFVETCFTILQPLQILFSFTKMDINCFTNGDVGEITIQNVTGGTPPYVYTIQCPSGIYLASPFFTGLPPGSYNLGVMDSKGCKSSCTPVPIIRPDSISIIFNPVNNPTGSGLNNGSITSSASGGVPPFTHFWFDSGGILIQQDAATTSTIQNLFAGAYCDSVVDANNCFNKKCTTLYQPAALIITVDSSNISCFGERDGWIELTISGGVPPYSVVYNGQTTILSSPPFTFRIQDLPAGNYTFVVTDNNMNAAVRTVIIIEPAPVIINFETHDVCFGSADGWIKATPLQGTPPYTYLWSNGETTDQINNLTPNLWYYLTVTDLRTCLAHDSAFLPENPQLFVHINNVDSTVCKGNSIQMNVDAYGGIYPYTYSWLPTTGVVNPDQLEPLITPVFSETYVITMTDTKGCVAKDSITIGIDSIPHAAFTFQNICQSLEVHFTNQSTGNGSGIYEYLWDFGDGYQSTEINPVHTYIMVGSYNVSLTVKNYSECTDYTMDTVYVNPVIQVDFSADTVCLGDETRFTGYSLNPGTVVDYGKWYFDDLNPITVQPWIPVMLHQFTYSGMHSVRLELFDNTGCSEGITKPVLVKSVPQVDFTYNWGCTSDTVKFTGQSSGAGGPAFWFWDFGDPPSGAANHAYIQNPSHVYNSPGLYHVTLKVTGVNTCDNSATKSFYYDKSPNAAFNWSSPCFGSETHFTDQSYASTGLLIMWQWNFGDPVTGPMNTSLLQNPSHTFSAPGTYQVKLKVYDNGLCYDSLIREVVIFASPTAGFNVTEGCVGEFTEFHDISVDPGSLINHWHWDFGDGNTMSYGSFTDPVIHPYAVSGQYVVVLTVTDTNGCSNFYTKFVNVHPLPTVMFQFNPACANQTTYFTDFSSGSGSPVISWYWDFGDFTPTSTLQNPTHIYTTPGLYPVTLCVTNAANCSSCNTQTISVSPSPVADFTADTVCKDSPTHFNNLSYCMGDNIVSWQWDFGDGSPTSNVQWPVHTFISAGTFNVSLIVTSLHGCISTIVKPVTVHDRPVANFSWNQTGGQNCFTPGVPTQFTDLSTIIGGNQLSSWLWDFGDGNYGNTQNPAHQYANTGIYYVTLTVFDINGCQNSIIKQVILAEKPIASFSYTISNCDEVCFTDASVGSGVSIQSWFWDFGDPASGVQNFSTQQNPCHIYYTPVTQTYSTRLIVTNANGCSDTLDLPVTVSKPVPDFATVNQPCQGVATEFQDLSVSAGNFISAWSWDFGDPGSASNTSSDQNPIHIYTSVGTKYVTLTITNGNGCTSNIGKPIEVSYPPQANWDFDRPNCFPDPTQFRDISMAQGSISIVSWDWNFGDGTPHSTLNDPVHSYLLEGTYPVTLTVVNANGCENYITKPFYNFRAPTAAFISDPVSKCIKEIVNFTDQSAPAFGNIVSWNWDFGDLSAHSTIQNPGHVYASAGIFTVKLIVIDERGCADSVSQTITVNDLPATNFIADTACLGSETHFTNQTSGTNLSWLWNFGEPSSGVFNTSTLENPVHQYSSAGDYFVQFTVTNSNSCRKDTVKKITVVPLPMVNFSNSSPCSGEAVHFTDESTIYQGTISEWKWNFGDGTGDFLGQNPTHTFINPGPYNVTLTITTTGNCPPTSATKQILIKSAPIADFAVSSLCVGPVQFNDMTNQNGGTSLISWDWNFGDPLSGPSNLSQLQNPIHIFTNPGIYLVSLIVANTDGCRDTLTSQVTVLPLPAVDFTAGLSCVSDTTCFLVNTVITNIGAITAFAWDLNGDGSIDSYDQNPCHVYPTSGTVNVTLTVTDTSGCKNSITHAINVKPPPIADFNTAGTNCSNDSIRFINHSTCSSGYITQWIWNFGDG